MKATPLSLLLIICPCSLAFVSHNNDAGKRRLTKVPPTFSPLPLVDEARRRSAQVVSLAGSSLETTSTMISLVEVAASLQFFYTAALVAGVGYTQRMAGR